MRILMVDGVLWERCSPDTVSEAFKAVVNSR